MPALRGRPYFPKHHHTIRVGPLGHIVDAPAVGGFREFLVVNEHKHRLEPRLNPARQDGFLEPRPARVDFAYLKCDMPASL